MLLSICRPAIVINMWQRCATPVIYAAGIDGNTVSYLVLMITCSRSNATRWFDSALRLFNSGFEREL